MAAENMVACVARSLAAMISTMWVSEVSEVFVFHEELSDLLESYITAHINAIVGPFIYCAAMKYTSSASLKIHLHDYPTLVRDFQGLKVRARKNLF